MDPSRADYVFVLAGDGRRWFIPTAAIEGRHAIHLGGDEVSEFEIDRSPTDRSLWSTARMSRL